MEIEQSAGAYKKAFLKKCVVFAFVIILVSVTLYLCWRVNHQWGKQGKRNEQQEVNLNDESISCRFDMYVIIKCLEQETWNKLTLEQRLRVLQDIVEIERWYLGVPSKLIIQAGDLPEEVLGRCYEDGVIQINSDLLMGGDIKDTLSAVLHECYHGYEYALVEFYKEVDTEHRKMEIFNIVEVYRDELKIGPAASGYSDYINQAKEKAARAYAEGALQDFEMHIVNYFLNKDDKEESHYESRK